MLKNTYFDLIDQTFYFPRLGFENRDNRLFFHDIDLNEVAEKFGTPLKLTYLPKISSQIQNAKGWFNKAIEKHNYKGKYLYAYCTKSSHFQFVLEEALKNDIHIETSSAFDINVVKKLYENGKITKDTFILCNGFKRPLYIDNIVDMVDKGFNIVPILDSKEELNEYDKLTDKQINLGIRIATDEEPNFEFYTSRLGVSYKDIVPFYEESIKTNPKFKLKMLHFFINSGIKDTTYYWSELTRCLNVYCDLKQVCPELDSMDIGGGFPIHTAFGFEYDYEYMVDQIVENIKQICDSRGVEVPNIFTEFGSYTVGESGAAIYSILGTKQQNDHELWYMIDSSFITTLPDAWGLGQRFVMFAINNWDKPYQRVNLGGITCDSQDYYNSETHLNQVFMPKVEEGDKQYIGFFHTGAYQESLGGYGGIQHCLVPAPKHVIIDKDEEGKPTFKLFAEEQTAENMLKTLGFK